jgi:hypothetical protein
MKHLRILLVIILLYLVSIAILQPDVYSYRFNTDIVDKYLCSQSITWEPPCKRLFLSDSDVHIGAAYMYVKGADPTVYHFEHGPLMKYLYGVTILLTGNPFHLEVLFGILYVLLSYTFAWKIFRSIPVAIATSVLLLIDPVFRNLTADASFELGQASFMLGYGLSVLFLRKNYVLQGILLGLFASAKFWGAVPFFMFMFHGYLYFKKQFNARAFIKHLLVAFLTYATTYLQAFVIRDGMFNIFWYQLRVIKFWFQHSSASMPFSSVTLFLGGFYKSWWGSDEIIRSQIWSIAWPASFVITLSATIKRLLGRVLTLKILAGALPIGYLLYLGIQAPFPRYFILLLPFFYMTSAHVVWKYIKQKGILKIS